MRQYELVTILRTEEEAIRQGKETVKNVLTANGAEIAKEDDMGDRELAYLIGKNKRGHYFLFNINLDQQKIPAIEKMLKLDANVIKYLFVRKEE
jgi:small subunit ribosomal protein S6